MNKVNGGARRDRTDDLMLAKHALSQLSYGPSISLPEGQKIRTALADDWNNHREAPSTPLMDQSHASGLRQTLSRPAFQLRWKDRWWAEEDLNLRPHAYQACALTT